MQLLCIGDVALADNNLLRQVWMPPAGMIPGPEVQVLFNWELPVGNTINPSPRSSGPRLLAFPDSPNVVRSWSPGLATLANNHILDAGNEGLANTIEALNRAGFLTVGAGQTQEEITSPLFWKTAEGRLAVVNWVFPETHPDWMAVPGPNCWPGLDEARYTIRELKHKSDWVLVVPHWSDEYFSYPRPEDRVIARQLAHMGADLVIGHHPHVVRGMEIIGSCSVFYSLGNFYFSDISDRRIGWIPLKAPRTREGLGIELSFRQGKSPEYKILSFWNIGRKVVLDPMHRAARRMELASQPLRQFRVSRYAEWYDVKRPRFDKWGYRWHFGLWQLDRDGLVRHLSRFLPSHWRSALNDNHIESQKTPDS